MSRWTRCRIIRYVIYRHITCIEGCGHSNRSLGCFHVNGRVGRNLARDLRFARVSLIIIEAEDNTPSLSPT